MADPAAEGWAEGGLRRALTFTARKRVGEHLNAMNRSFSSLAIACFLAGSAHVPAGAQAEHSEPVIIDGGCSYSDRFAPLLEQGHVFLECDRLVMRRSGRQVEVGFTFPARMRSVEFRGAFGEAGGFDVSAIRLRTRRDWEEAEGNCEFDPAGGDRPSAVCVVKSGPRFFVANFVPED
ncbi:MAG: hypothetical protein ACX930_15260 [Erythrobacter sp.]